MLRGLLIGSHQDRVTRCSSCLALWRSASGCSAPMHLLRPSKSKQQAQTSVQYNTRSCLGIDPTHQAHSICLSIDPGTLNTGICLVDSTTQAIIYWGLHKLLEQHEQVVTSTDQIKSVKRHLDDITAAVGATFQGRDYWVLIEQQLGTRRPNLVWLQQAILMYYLMKDKMVRLIDARARFTFLNIKDWAKSTRYYRKTKVTNKIKELLAQAGPANRFASADHHSTTWRAHKENQHGMADSLAQVLCYFYRTLQDVVDGDVVQAEQADRLVAFTRSGPDQDEAATSNPQRRMEPPAAAGTSRRRPAHQAPPPPAALQVKANLQKLLLQLAVDFPDLFPKRRKGTSATQPSISNGQKLLRVLESHEHHPGIASWMQQLDACNHKGTALDANLNARLAHLMQSGCQPL